LKDEEKTGGRNMKTKRSRWISRTAVAIGVAVLAWGTADAAIVNVAPSATLTLGAGSGSGGVNGSVSSLPATNLKNNDTADQGIVDGGFYKIDARATLNYDPIYLYFTYAEPQTISGYGKYKSPSSDTPMWGSLEYSTDGGTTWKLAASQLSAVGAGSNYNTDGSGTVFPGMTATHWRFRSMLDNSFGDSFSPVRSRIRWAEFYLWNYTDADASSVPATKQVNASMYITSVDVSSDGVSGYNSYFNTVRGSDAAYVNRSGGPVTFTYVFDEPHAISGFGSKNGTASGTAGVITLEYSTDGENYTTVSGLPGGNQKDFNMDGTDPNWTFAPITAQYWKYSHSNPGNNLYQFQVYFFTTVTPPPPPPKGTVILMR